MIRSTIVGCLAVLFASLSTQAITIPERPVFGIGTIMSLESGWAAEGATDVIDVELFIETVELDPESAAVARDLMLEANAKFQLQREALEQLSDDTIGELQAFRQSIPIAQQHASVVRETLEAMSLLVPAGKEDRFATFLRRNYRRGYIGTVHRHERSILVDIQRLIEEEPRFQSYVEDESSEISIVLAAWEKSIEGILHTLDQGFVEFIDYLEEIEEYEDEDNFIDYLPRSLLKLMSKMMAEQYKTIELTDGIIERMSRVMGHADGQLLQDAYTKQKYPGVYEPFGIEVSLDRAIRDTTIDSVVRAKLERIQSRSVPELQSVRKQLCKAIDAIAKSRAEYGPNDNPEGHAAYEKQWEADSALRTALQALKEQVVDTIGEARAMEFGVVLDISDK